MDFALGQIASGIAVFRKVLAGNTEEMAQLLIDYDDMEIEDCQAYDTDDSDNNDAAEASEASSATGELRSTVTEISIPDVRSFLDPNGVHVKTFPLELSQGCIDGRSGSSACSIIALIMAQVISTNLNLKAQGVLSLFWSTLVLHSMVAGNNIYDIYRASLPVQYLSAAEAFDIMTRADNFEIELEDPLPMRLVDQQYKYNWDCLPKLPKEEWQFLLHQKKLPCLLLTYRT